VLVFAQLSGLSNCRFAHTAKIANTASTVVTQMITWTRILRPRPMGRFSRLASCAVGATSPAGAPGEDSAIIYSLAIRPPRIN
jgi:hypothetical protein